MVGKLVYTACGLVGDRAALERWFGSVLGRTEASSLGPKRPWGSRVESFQGSFSAVDTLLARESEMRREKKNRLRRGR
jgi:hypothetical protein